MFCIRCGIEITNGDLICQDCRNAAETGALNAPVNNPVGYDAATNSQNIVNAAEPVYYDPAIDTLDIPEMTLEESVACCAKAQNGFYSLEEKHREDLNINRTLAILQQPPKKHSFLFFFWPFLVSVPISFCVMIFVCVINNFSATLILSVPAIIFILGIVISIFVRRIVNAAIANGQGDKIQKLHTRQEQLQSEISVTKLQLNHEYQWIPERFRSSYHMGLIVGFLQSGQAKNIRNAFKLLC